MTNQDTPTTWADMTPEEKGALLLAKHEGWDIQGWLSVEGWANVYPSWHDREAYRVKPEPKRETVKMVGFTHNHEWFFRGRDARVTHRITFDTIDGEPDCATIRMERLT